LMHIGNDDELAETAMGDLAICEMDRDDPGDPTTALQRGIGQEPHQPVVSAAIDQPDAGARQPGAELGSGGAIARVDRAGGAAIDAEMPDLPPHRSASQVGASPRRPPSSSVCRVIASVVGAA